MAWTADLIVAQVRAFEYICDTSDNIEVLKAIQTELISPLASAAHSPFPTVAKWGLERLQEILDAKSKLPDGGGSEGPATAVPSGHQDKPDHREARKQKRPPVARAVAKVPRR